MKRSDIPEFSGWKVEFPLNWIDVEVFHAVAGGIFKLFVNTTTSNVKDTIDHEAEPRLVSFMLAVAEWRQELLQDMDLPDSASVGDGVAEPVVVRSGRPGDIDILAFARPDLACAVQVKVLRVRLGDVDSPGFIRNEEKIDDAVGQANSMHALGFHRSWLLLMLVVDARSSNAKNVFNKVGHSETIRAFVNEDLSGLNPNVGIILGLVVQPADVSHQRMLGYGLLCDRSAARQAQPTALSNKIDAWLVARDAHRR